MAKNKGFSSRTKARSRAVDVIYEAQIKRLDDPAGIFGLAQERSVESTAQTPIPPYALEICEGVAEHLSRIDSLLENYAQGWTLQRMAQVDLAILRVACWEILFNPEIDGPTAISEGMKIAREKSTDESPRFLNGLLGRINDLAPSLIEPEESEDSEPEEQPEEPEAPEELEELEEQADTPEAEAKAEWEIELEAAQETELAEEPDL